MSTFLSNIHALALGAGVAFAGLTPAVASSLVVPSRSAMQTGVIQVLDSATVVIRRKDAHHDSVWKKRRHHRQDREARRDRWRDVHDHDGRGRQFRPRATPKYAYDADGNLRVYDGKRWDNRDWDRHDGWRRGDDWRHGDDWYKREHGPRIYKLRKSTVQGVPSVLDDILTAVPD
jgi:hypothetical protein